MLQLVYVSSATPGSPINAEALLAISRRNNSRDGITGLLFSDGVRFLQALEGPADKVEATYARIKANPYHRAIVQLSRREIQVREFGDWAMAHQIPGGDADRFIERVRALTANASPNVRATFEGFVQVRRAA